MPLAARGVLPCQCERAEIREDESVDARGVQLLEIDRERGGLIIAGMILTVQWTFTPAAWASCTAFGSSSGVKLPVNERMPKLVPARYTASAP